MSKNKQQNKRNKKPQVSKKQHSKPQTRAAFYAAKTKKTAARILAGDENVLETVFDINLTLGYGLDIYLKLGYRVSLICKRVIVDHALSKNARKIPVFDLLLFSFITVSHRAFEWKMYNKYFCVKELTMEDGSSTRVLINKNAKLPDDVKSKDVDATLHYINHLLRKDLTCMELIEILIDKQWDPCYFESTASREYFKENDGILDIYITTGFRQVNVPCTATIHIWTGDECTVHTFGIMDFKAEIRTDENGKRWLYYDLSTLKFVYIGPTDYYPHLSQLTPQLRTKLGYLLDYVYIMSSQEDEETKKQELKKMKDCILSSRIVEDEDDFDEAVECLIDATLVSKPIVINDLLSDEQKFTLAKILILPVSFTQHDFDTYTHSCVLEQDGTCHHEVPCERQVLRPRHASIDIPWGSSIEDALDKWIQEYGYNKDEAVRLVEEPVSTE